MSTSFSGFLDTKSPDQIIDVMYIAYFDRAPDAEGFQFWAGQYNTYISQGQSADQILINIANSFAPQPESFAEYPFLELAGPISATIPADVTGVEQLVGNAYTNMFDRTPSMSELNSWSTANVTGAGYWVKSILNGTVNVGDALLEIANGAGTATGAGMAQSLLDAATLENKIIVADDFVTQSNLAGIAQTPPSAVYIEEARAVIKFTNSTQESVTEAEAAILAFFSGPNLGTVFTGPGATFALTISADTITGNGYDTFNALLASPQGGQLTDQPTLTSGDNLTEISPTPAPL